MESLELGSVGDVGASAFVNFLILGDGGFDDGIGCLGLGGLGDGGLLISSGGGGGSGSLGLLPSQRNRHEDRQPGLYRRQRP